MLVFRVRRLHHGYAAEVARKMAIQDEHGSFVIGKGVFDVMFITVPDTPVVTYWLMQFYESISFEVAAASQSYFDQLRVRPETSFSFSCPPEADDRVGQMDEG